MLQAVEYIWLDGVKPTQQIRAKSRILNLPEEAELTDFPIWSFDGSSTSQANSKGSDCYLRPVCFVIHPFENGYAVLCEVLDENGNIHESNQRAKLRKVLDQCPQDAPWLGFEQEYTLFENNRPLGWPEHGAPAPQGPYYCGVGTRQIFGREFAVAHQNLCLEAGLLFFGINAEVMPGQWEFQIGYRGDGEDAGALRVCDHLIIARWILHRLSEDFSYHVSLSNKPVEGDWNGAGLHTNYSSQAMRQADGGMKAIENAIELLKTNHAEHIKYYGDGLAQRLTGLHETAPIDKFSWGVGSRDTSVRVPKGVAKAGCGYLEDRRPGANADPYEVALCLVQSIHQIQKETVSD